MTQPYPLLSVPLEHPGMLAAKDVALDQPESKQPYLVGCVVIKNGTVIGHANNYNPYHETNGCERRKLNVPSGLDYHLCQGCNPETHSEPRAIQNAISNGHDVTDAVIYMYGHYDACENCMHVMKENHIASY